MDTVLDSLQQFWQFTGFANCTWQHLVMILIGLIFITLGIVKKWEPLLLVPIGFGMIVGNIPLFFDPVTGAGLRIGIYEETRCSTSCTTVCATAGIRRSSSWASVP